MNDLIEYLYHTTAMNHDEVTELVRKGMMLNWTADEMRQHGDHLADALACAAAGFSKEQIDVWHDRLQMLLVGYRRFNIGPDAVPTVRHPS